MNNKDFDIVVIGSGVIGHSIAYLLKQGDPQLRVAILGDPVNSLQASRGCRRNVGSLLRMQGRRSLFRVLSRIVKQVS